MKISWIIVVLVLVAAMLLIVFLIKQNRKDEKELIEYLDKEEAEPENEE